MTDWLNVGKIVNTHGVQGEVRVISKTDFPESRYAEGSRLAVYKEGQKRIPVTVRTWRKHKKFDLLTFEGYHNLNDVEPFKGTLLQVDTGSIEDDLTEDEYYFHEIIGLRVKTDDGHYIGEVKEILTPGANDVWVIKPESGKNDILIPYIDSVVKEVDLESGIILITPMEGLLD